MDLKANEEFEAWAKGPSGFDGGNLNGAVWFCGIEWGAGDSEDSLKFSSLDAAPSVEGEARSSFLNPQYNWKLVKLYAAMLGYPPSQYGAVYKDTSAFSKESDTCKLNLYPIAFKDTDESLWAEWLRDRTGLPTKALYLAWCQLNRFPVFTDLAVRRKPKAIVCTGLQWSKHFLMAFAGMDNAFLDLARRPVAGRELRWAPINNGNSMLFITPFLGRGGLISDEQIEAFGKEIASLCREHFASNWCRHLAEST
jgi:hypothetical protein